MFIKYFYQENGASQSNSTYVIFIFTETPGTSRGCVKRAIVETVSTKQEEKPPWRNPAGFVCSGSTLNSASQVPSPPLTMLTCLLVQLHQLLSACIGCFIPFDRFCYQNIPELFFLTKGPARIVTCFCSFYPARNNLKTLVQKQRINHI